MPFSTSVNFGPYDSEQTNIERKKKIAQLLQTEAFKPIAEQQGRRFAVPTSPLVGISKVLGAGLGAYQEGRAGTEQQALQQRMQSERQAALAKALQQSQGAPQPPAEQGGGPAMPPDPVGAMGTLGQTGDPAVMQMGAPFAQMAQQQMLAQQKQQQSQQELAARQSEAQRAEQTRLQESQRRQQSEQQFRAEQASQSQGLQRELAQLRTDSTQQRPPPGYRPTPEGNLQAIPGGPADTKLQGAFNQDTASLQSSESALDRLEAAANEVMNHPGLSRITGLMGAVPNVPGTAASDAAAKLEQLKSQAGFAVLQAMREASKTGGALGQVSNFEVQQLQNNLAALQQAQSHKQIKSELAKIMQYTQSAKGRLRNAYNMKHGGQQEQQGQGALTPQEQQELNQLRQRFGR